MSATHADRVRSLVARPDLSADESAQAMTAALAGTSLDAPRMAFLGEVVQGGGSAASRPVLVVATVRAVLARIDALYAQHPADLDRTPALVDVARGYVFVAGEASGADPGVDTTAAAFVPVMTRVRSPSGQSGPPSGPVPITRSIYRRVVKERAAVLAAVAPSEVGETESMLGASIRSTIGVPLWKGEEIIGVLQADNRNAPGTLHALDVELLLVLAANASLAVANARLIKRLTTAEDRLLKENNWSTRCSSSSACPI